jgi:CRISPR-associated protein Cas2
MFERLSQYKIMWVIVFFDLPVQTKKQRRAYADFRKSLLKDGFDMFQFSIYIRHCLSKENAQVHINRVKQALPQYGHVVIMTITDKQFGDIEVFYEAKPKDPPKGGRQLQMF